MLRIEIREATWDLHRKLEQTPVAQRVMAQDVCLEDYKIFLASWMCGMLTLESSLLAINSRWRELLVQRRHRLRQDCEELGIRVTRQLDEQSISFSCKLDYVSSYGVFYVLEGSRLGLSAVSSHLRARLGPHYPNLPMRFVSPHREEPQSRWSAFVRELNELNLSGQPSAKVVSAARESFELLTNFFERREKNLRPLNPRNCRGG